MKRLILILLALSVIGALSFAAADETLCTECGDTASDMLLVSSTGDSHTLECFCGKQFTLPHTWSGWQSNGDGTHTRRCTAGCVQTDSCSGGTADCTSPAVCSTCSGAYGSVNPDAHRWDEGSVTVEPTCRSLGAFTYTCLNNPAHTRTEALDINPDAHFFRDGVVVTPATCSHEGVMKYTCLYSAQHTKEEAIPIDPDAHRWNGGVVISEATCTTPGETLYTCLDNPAHTRIDTTPVDLSKHVWGERFVSREPTCTRDGVITLVCAHDPSHTGSEAIPATGHSWSVATITKHPTCTEPGVMTYTCVHDPSHTYTEEIPATGHRWGNMQIIKEPTCISEGEKSYICGYDIDHEHVVTIGIDPNAHDYQPTDRMITLPGPCVDGTARIDRCALCGHETAVTTVEPLNHTYSVWTKSGDHHISVCDVCGGAPISVVCHDTPASPCPVCLQPDMKLSSIGSVYLRDTDDEDDYHAVGSGGAGTVHIGMYDEQNGRLEPDSPDTLLYIHLSAAQLAGSFSGSTENLPQRAYAILTSESLRIHRRDDLVMLRSDDDKLLLHVMHYEPDDESDELFCHIESNTISFRVSRRQWDNHEITIWLELEEP